MPKLISANPVALLERLFPMLEVALIVVFVLTLIAPGTLGDTFGFPWILLWLVAFTGLVPGLTSLATGGWRWTGWPWPDSVRSGPNLRAIQTMGR
jgi:hypothetical protein